VKAVAFAGGAAGVLLLSGLAVRTDLGAMLGALASGGWKLSWLLPYRALFYALYAMSFSRLLQAADPACRAPFSYIFWVTSVREAVDRLLPVASVGGSFVGVRLMAWRGLDAATIGASVIMETVLTLVNSYMFAAAGVVLLAGIGAAHQEYRRVILTLLMSLPVPLAMILLLRHGAVFERLEKVAARFSALKFPSNGAARLDHRVNLMLRNRAGLARAGGLEVIALTSGCFEIWFALRLLGHPVTIAQAVILESMTVALRHVAFFVPAGIGVQEAGLVVFGRLLGIDGELALAVSMVKRTRELCWGIPSLLSWQWLEGRRLQRVQAT
jgi:putative membrane protein